METVLSDDFIDNLFAGTNFGNPVNSCVKAKRRLLLKTLQNQIDGYWSGHAAYHICVNGGFLLDAKTDEPKKLTALGTAFLKENKTL